MNHIITGSPSSGKTSLINALKHKGYTCYDEIARMVIKQQMPLHSDVLPWLNLEAFSAEVLSQMLIQYRSVKKNNSKHSFYDRAIPDIMAYLNIGKIPIGKQYYDALAQTDYQKNVFILPPVKKIYNTDNERLESFEFAQKLHEQLVNTYTNLGFSLIEVPFGNIEERVTFVTDKI